MARLSVRSCPTAARSHSARMLLISLIGRLTIIVSHPSIYASQYTNLRVVSGFFFRLKASSGALSEVDRLYDLQTVLGTGSFGTVMKALNKAEGAWYAVKIIPASKLRKAITHGTLGSMSPENIPKSLKREIDIMQRLKHRHICQFKEVFYDTKEISTA